MVKILNKVRQIEKASVRELIHLINFHAKLLFSYWV